MAAPIAVFDENEDQDCEEWPEFIDYRTSSDIVNSNGDVYSDFSSKEEINVDNFSEMRSDSIEDLVNNFDDKLASCFRNFNLNTDRFAPVKILSQEEIMKNCKLWKKVTDNFGQVMPLDWSTSRTRAKQLPALNLKPNRPADTTTNLDLPDDEDLAESFDMHSMILTSVHNDNNDVPVLTADQVIEEIDEIFKESESSLDEKADEDILSTISDELQVLRERSMTTSSYEESKAAQDGWQELKTMSLQALNELLEELDQTIKDYSQVLVHDLALREELEFEKEMKNQFISALVKVQNKQKSLKVKKQGKKGKNGVEPGLYLTTRIPYNKPRGPPNIQTLQIVTKILRAMDEDSKEVPDLLTNYILKVLCPT
ncbi:fasciculation and elongation protein zeta-2-like isoform X2 [Anneissia japonica]|uniref:fasciculation and elongation protein zeta-2-like isoform X2 n=1 Tax=Anneissia japonica TaxID=1529436 RepID=UPI0014259580|nr:fasciculation and elongation protein zeta-2-like isoform X2 [Anneissia japonica]